MRFAVGLAKEDSQDRMEALEAEGISRRQFMKFCTAVAIAMGMGPAYAAEVAKTLTTKRRPSVVYLHNAECTGCSEALLRTTGEFPLDKLLFDTISLEYQETIMAAAGDAAEKALHDAVTSPHGFICIVEGAIPMGQDGIFGKVGNRTMLEINREILLSPNCKAIVSYGTCAAYGGIQAAKPNPTEAKGIEGAIPELKGKVINVPGCPPNPINIVGTLVYFLQNNAIPPLDSVGRPELFFGASVHELCERLPHFEAGEFADSFDSEEARKGWCLYNLGCKGPSTYNNCPKVRFNDTNWPVGAGHPCIGCSEPDFWDQMSPFYES